MPRRLVGYWLLGGSGLVAGMVTLGGLTRLTESGLSMVDWHLIHFRAPRSDREWEAYFERYKQFPEYQMKNQGMSLSQFKRIYFMEHSHRVLGRLVGAYFLIPTLFLTFRWSIGRFPFGGLVGRLWALDALIGSQGLLGWYMVKSGLDRSSVERRGQVRVSALRLTSHLALALGLFGATLFTALRELGWRAAGVPTRFRRLIACNVALIGVTVTFGGLVAGLEAGSLYQTFPLMGETWVPQEVADLRPWHRNITENPATVQFLHRYAAKATIAGIFTSWLLATRRYKEVIPRTSLRLLKGMLGISLAQGTLGAATLLSGVPISLASLHQTGAIALLGSGVATLASISP